MVDVHLSLVRKKEFPSHLKILKFQITLPNRQKIQKGEGSLGMLVHDARLYTNLSSASKELDALIRDLKTNPGKYLKLSIFVKKDTR